MSNVIIAIATLVIGFVLATYGAYTGHYAMKRSEFMSRVGHAVEAQLVYVSGVREDLGRVPDASDLVMNRISKFNGHGITYTYGRSGAQGYICARSARRDYVDEAFKLVAETRPGALYGSTCNTSGGPSGSSVSVTVRIS